MSKSKLESAQDKNAAREIKRLGVRFTAPFYWEPKATKASASPATVRAAARAFKRDDVSDAHCILGEPRVVAEGDSWFDHPGLRDIPDHLEKWTCIVHSHRPGKTLRESVEAGRYLDAFKPGALAAPPKAVILSGGGNDIFSWERTSRRRSSIFQASSGTSAAGFIDDEALDRFFVFYRNQLKRFASSIRRKSSTVKILTHCYDYIRPSRFSVLPGLGGPWVYPQLRDVDAPVELDMAICRELLRRWNNVCRRICNEVGMIYVDLRGITSTDADWADEIHPKSDLFEEMAQRFYAKLPK